MKLGGFANDILSAISGGTEDAPSERRQEPRGQYLGRKIIIRQRKAIGIMHLRNISSHGACGITDMPLAVGSLVFL